MDVRAFLEHRAADRPREGRKLLERHLPLPAVLTAVCDHPCENACLRRDLGGSIAVSALEMSQNSTRNMWTEEKVDHKLKEIMINIHDSSAAASEEYGLGYDLIAGANIAGFTKVANAMLEQGLV